MGRRGEKAGAGGSEQEAGARITLKAGVSERGAGSPAEHLRWGASSATPESSKKFVRALKGRDVLSPASRALIF